MKRGQLIRNILNSRSNAKGLLGETLAIQGMRRHISVQKTSRIGHSGDCKINHVAIEIKTALMNKRGEFKICLRKNDEHGYTDFRHSVYVLIQLVTNSGRTTLYLIPTVVLIDLKNMCIGLNSRKYAKYRVDSYKSVATLIKGTDAQLTSDYFSKHG